MSMPLRNAVLAVRKQQQSSLAHFLPLALCLALLALCSSPAQAQQERSALDALAALAENPSGPLAATSENCLQRCLGDCPPAPDRKACLRVCLSGCREYCGTVDTACALEWLGKNGGAEPVGRSLAAACAGACTVKPNCPPPAKIALLAPLPADPTPAPPPALSQNPAPREGETLFQPQDRSFRLLVPQGWSLSEDDSRGKGGEYELRLTVPGVAGLDYVLFSVRRVSAPHRTAERFVHDLQHPRFGGRADRTALSAVTLAGLPAAQVEVRSVRTLLGLEDQVPIVARTVVLKRSAGYFALASEVPEALEQQFGPALERLFQSFRPEARQQAPSVEVSAQEYAVYAAFLTSGGELEPGQRGGPPKGLLEDEAVPYLRDTGRSRTLYAATVQGPELTAKLSASLAKVCGAASLAAGLAQDYANKRTQQAVVADRIVSPDLRIKDSSRDAGPDREQLLGRMGAQHELMGRLSRGAFDDPLSVSRVGFSQDGQSALFYVRKLATSPGTTHFVLMRLREGRWTLACALMDEMRIY